MEKETKYLIGGIIIVSLCYLIPSFLGYIWLGLFSSLFVAIIYLRLLHKEGKKKFSKENSVKVTSTLFSLTILASLLLFGLDYYKADFQREVLREIRVIIDTGIFEHEAQGELLQVYKEYLSEPSQDASIVETATDFFGDRLQENNVYIPGIKTDEKDAVFRYQKDEESDRFIIYSIAKISQSRDPNFENANGSNGLLQTITILTNEGVTHEREN